jgi:hypothetical protein
MSKWFKLMDIREVGVAASTVIKAGEIVCQRTGALGAVSASSDANGLRVLGIALDDSDNSAGTAEAKMVRYGTGIVQVPGLHLNSTWLGRSVRAINATTVSGSTAGGPVAGTLHAMVSGSSTQALVWIGRRE